MKLPSNAGRMLSDRHYEKRLVSLFKACDLKDPACLQIVARAISMCAEFGGDVFKPHLPEALSALEGTLKDPNMWHPDSVMEREISIVALGKICQFHCNDPDAHQVMDLWLSYLPLQNMLVDAKLIHNVLCTMVEKSEKKVLGPHADFRRIISIFAEVMWAGNNLATEETLRRMKKILKKFQQRIPPSHLESICSSFPLPLRSMLESFFFSSV